MEYLYYADEEDAIAFDKRKITVSELIDRACNYVKQGQVYRITVKIECCIPVNIVNLTEEKE